MAVPLYQWCEQHIEWQRAKKPLWSPRPLSLLWSAYQQVSQWSDIGRSISQESSDKINVQVLWHLRLEFQKQVPSVLFRMICVQVKLPKRTWFFSLSSFCWRKNWDRIEIPLGLFFSNFFSSLGYIFVAVIAQINHFTQAPTWIPQNQVKCREEENNWKGKIDVLYIN